MHIDPGIWIGLLLLAIIGLVAWVAKHPPQAAQPNAKDLAATLSAGASETWEALKRDLPEIVSAEVAQLRNALAQAQADAASWKAKLIAEQNASAARLEAVKAQVGSVISGISAQPTSALVAPAVAAAQAEDVAAVRAATAAISPAN